MRAVGGISDDPPVAREGLVDEAALARLAPGVPTVLLLADICRRDLRIEIDGVHS